MMERAVDAACPEHGENPACECVSCQIRKACGMMFKTAPAASAVEAAPERWDRETSDPIADIEEGRHFHDPSTPCAHDEKTECDDCNDCGAVLPEPAAPEEVPR